MLSRHLCYIPQDLANGSPYPQGSPLGGVLTKEGPLAAFFGVLRKLTHSYIVGNAEHSTATVPIWLAFFSHTLVHISHQVYSKNNSGAKGKSLNILISMSTCGLLSMN